MIDFSTNSIFAKLSKAIGNPFSRELSTILVDGEEILSVFTGIRDGVVFTNKRLIAINVQGFTGKKKDFTSLPYRSIQAFSAETAGHFDADSELELWFSGLGRVKFEFTKGTNIKAICQLIGSKIL